MDKMEFYKKFINEKWFRECPSCKSVRRVHWNPSKDNQIGDFGVCVMCFKESLEKEKEEREAGNKK